MLLIPCPWCGPRDEVEFGYGGQAHVPYPADPAALDDAAWGSYLFVRDNPKGWFAERWVHTHGCRRWFTVLRHTVTNEIATANRQLALPPGPESATVRSSRPAVDEPSPELSPEPLSPSPGPSQGPRRPAVAEHAGVSS